MRLPKSVLSLLPLLLLAPLLVHAVDFSDVPSGHPFADDIALLVKIGAINGNPDGTFKPDEAVNRAALLKMLYKAADLAPGMQVAACFPKEIGEKEWYRPFVCDAVAKKFVNGYGDGTFKPARAVSRAEALKLAMVILGVPLDGSVSALDPSLSGYLDVADGDWYAGLIARAQAAKILPLHGKEHAVQFFPNEPLSRGEAAAMIMSVLKTVRAVSSSSSLAASSSVASSVSSSLPGSSAASLSSAHSATSYDDTGATAAVVQSDIPFALDGRFAGKASVSYRFSLTSSIVVSAVARVKSGERGGITCTLYRLETSGISTEYYIGYVDGSSCTLRVALLAGSYQLQVQPTAADSAYTIDAEEGTGDDTDGIRQAKLVTKGGSALTDVLDEGDPEDWFVFRVSKEMPGTLSFTSTSTLRCLIFPSSDVDMFGFEGPSCGKSFQYQPGTYYVGIGHAYPLNQRQTYTIQFQ